MVKLSNYERESIILFNEAEEFAEVYTHNADLKKRLKMLAREHPEDCTFAGKNAWGGHFYRVSKRLVHISKPKSRKWREAVSAKAKESGRRPPMHQKKE